MKNYAVAPGEYLAEWMDEHSDVTQAQLANRIGVSRKQVNAILNGRAPISAPVATKLERVTSIPAKAWLLYQSQYDADIARLNDEAELAKHVDVISPKLGAYLRKIGATVATRRNPGRLVADFLAHIHCGTFGAFEARCAEEIGGGYGYAALKESGKKIDPAMLLAWVASAEKQDEAGRRFEASYSEEALRNAIPRIRQRVQAPNESMLQDVQSILADAGVTMLYCDPPEGFPLHGLTYWVNDAPVVVFTARRKKDGYVIWALFHELGHVLNDERAGGALGLKKTRKQKQEEEKQANAFAKKALFGNAGLSPFHDLTRSHEIREAANRVGVSPGVAVVAMRKKKMLDYSWGNDLLVDVRI